MSAIWRRALHFTVTVKRNTTSVSASGASQFVYATIATGLACSIQSGSGGRMRQEDVGQVAGKKHSAIFGEEALGLLQQNDLIIVENAVGGGETFKLYHVHEIIDPNAPHVECDVESWVPAGGVV